MLCLRLPLEAEALGMAHAKDGPGSRTGPSRAIGRPAADGVAFYRPERDKRASDRGASFKVLVIDEVCFVSATGVAKDLLKVIVYDAAGNATSRLGLRMHLLPALLVVLAGTPVVVAACASLAPIEREP